MKIVNYNELSKTRLEIGDMIRIYDFTYVVKQRKITSINHAVPTIQYTADLYSIYTPRGNYVYPEGISNEIINKTICITTEYNSIPHIKEEEYNTEEWVKLLNE